MKFGATKAKFSYGKKDTDDAKTKGNIVDIDLTYLKNEVVMSEGKPVMCSECKACLSHFDDISSGSVNFVEQPIK